jgi:hypothetical protein
MTGFGWTRVNTNTADGRATSRQQRVTVLVAVDLRVA